MARSQRQENGIAGQIGGQRTVASGSGWAVKNDIRNEKFSVEAKYTDKKSYSLKEEDLLKAERQALMDSGRDFAFVVQMAGGRQWVVLSLETAVGAGVFGGSTDEG